MSFKKIRDMITSKQAVMLILSAFLSCSSVYSATDFSYLSINSSKPIKLINPLYLDTSRTVKPVIKITTPYNGELNESDYFSSTIDEKELPPIEEEAPKIENSDLERKNFEIKKENEVINDFFAPPDSVVEKEIQSIENYLDADEDNDTYAAGVNSSSDVDLEGKIVNNIYFEGLKTINPESIRNQIRTQSGSVFNEDLLQQDLQRIYSIGFFTEKMAIEPEINKDGTVNLRFILEENIPVKGVSIVGNTVISSMELMPFVTSLQDLPQNITNINEAIDKINNYYHTKGYILA